MAYDLHKLSLRDFCRQKAEIKLNLLAQQLPRLSEAIDAPLAAPASATLSGYERRRGDQSIEHELCVTVAATVHLQCQRCLESYQEAISSTSRFVLVKDDEALEAYEDEHANDDAAPEPLAANAPCDVLSLIEDELLLALPIVPKHASCPTELVDGLMGSIAAAGNEALDPQPPASPFAALAGLKKSRR